MKWHSTGSLISNLAQTAMSYCQLATEGPGWPQNCQLHLKKSTCSRKSRSSKHNLEWEEEEQRGLMSLCFSRSLWHDARSGALWRTVSPCAIWVRIWFVNNSKAWLNVFGGLDDSVGVRGVTSTTPLSTNYRPRLFLTFFQSTEIFNFTFGKWFMGENTSVQISAWQLGHREGYMDVKFCDAFHFYNFICLNNSVPFT